MTAKEEIDRMNQEFSKDSENSRFSGFPSETTGKVEVKEKVE